MKTKTLAALALGLCLGYSFQVVIPLDKFNGSEDIVIISNEEEVIDNLKSELAASKALAKNLRAELTKALADQNSNSPDRTKSLTTTSNEPININAESLEFQNLIDQGTEAVEIEGQTQEAQKLFNLALIKSTSEEQRNDAIEGLLKVHQLNFDAVMDEGTYLHIALWELFEMHKLRPSEEISQHVSTVFIQAYDRIAIYASEDDLLNQSDYLATLLHISKTTGIEIKNQQLEIIDIANVTSQLSEVQQKSDFLSRLNKRAAHNLTKGSEIQRAIVFWDYAKIAELSDPKIWQEETFKANFTQATLQHLNNLKEMNQPGEIQSRLDYVRYAFPELLKDERLYNFH